MNSHFNIHACIHLLAYSTQTNDKIYRVTEYIGYRTHPDSSTLLTREVESMMPTFDHYYTLG